MYDRFLYGAIGVAGCCLLILLVFILPLGVASALLAHRGAHAAITVIHGRCFSVLISPPIDPPIYFFARIGLSRETARWYMLPVDWESVVTPSEDEIELSVLAETGWVERLRRFGAKPAELTQPVPQALTRAEIRAERRATRANTTAATAVAVAAQDSDVTDVNGAAQASEDATHGGPEGKEGKEARWESAWKAAEIAEEAWEAEKSPGATNEERRELRRFARRQSLEWRASPRSLAVNGWVMIIAGIVFGPGIVVVAVVLVLAYPKGFTDQGGVVAGIISVALFFVIGCALIILGILLLRVWRRALQSAGEAPMSVTGEVLSWMVYRDMWTPTGWPDWGNRRETLIQLRIADGTTHIYRIPVRYMRRVRQRGARVQVEYLPTTERVVDVTRVPAPAERVANTLSDPAEL